MQPNSNFTFDQLFTDESVNAAYIQLIKSLLEANALSSKWKFFHEYYEGAEGIRYAFDVVFADWLVPRQDKEEQIRIPHLFLRSKLFTLLREIRLD